MAKINCGNCQAELDTETGATFITEETVSVEALQAEITKLTEMKERLQNASVRTVEEITAESKPAGKSVLSKIWNGSGD